MKYIPHSSIQHIFGDTHHLPFRPVAEGKTEKIPPVLVVSNKQVSSKHVDALIVRMYRVKEGRVRQK